MVEDQAMKRVDERVVEFLAKHRDEEGFAFQVMHEAFQRMKGRNIPTLIMYKETDRLAQLLAIDFIEGFHDEELLAFDILATATEMNECEVGWSGPRESG